jgi:plastocyanin
MRLPLYFGIVALWVSALPPALHAQAADTAAAGHRAAGAAAHHPKKHKKKAGKPAGAAAGAPAAGAAAAAKPADSAAAKTGDKSTDLVKWDPSTKTTTFQLIAGPFVFDGYGNGQATLVVPSSSTVVWNFVNEDGTPHSAELIDDKDPMPNAGGEPAIPRAYTKKVVEGLPQGAKDVVRFSVPESGKYRIFCGVPGHGLSGMWIRMRVDPAATTPTFETPKK